MIVYDAENQILGRLASVIAKQLLKGEQVFVVNAEKTLLLGSPAFAINAYKARVQRGDPLHGPFFPKPPMLIFRRTVRGMLPWHRPKGRKAFKNLKVFTGIPEELKDKKFVRVKNAEVAELKTKYITLGKLSVALGAKERW